MINKTSKSVLLSIVQNGYLMNKSFCLNDQ